MTTLGDVCTVRSSLVDPTRPEFACLPHIAPDSIEKGSGRLLGYRTAGEDGVTSGKYRFEAGDVLYSKIRPNLNKVALIDHAGVCSADMYALDVDRNLAIPEFVAYVLRSQEFLDYATSLSNRANIPKLNREQLLRFDLHLPPLPEQRRIAAILDHADALRAKRRQVLTHLDSLTQSIFNDMFKTYEWLIEFGSIIVSGPTNGMYRPASDYGDGVPILRIESFSSGEVLASRANWKRLRADESEIRRYSLSAGDLVVNRVNALSHLGKSALVAAIDEPSVYESNMMRIRIDPDRACPDFVLAWLQSPRTKQQILRKAKKAINQASINQTDVRSLLLPLPPLDLQHRFAAQVKAVNVQSAAVQRSLTTEDSLFASLQSRAFRRDL